MVQQKFMCLLQITVLLFTTPSSGQDSRRLGKFQEVFAWKQLTYNVNGNILLQNRFGEPEEDGYNSRVRRQSDSVYFVNNDPETIWNQHSGFSSRPSRPSRPTFWNNRPTQTTTTTTVRPQDEAGQFFIQYNNVPMGVERVGQRLFVTVPRRRYGIPATLNYIDLSQDSNTRSPALKPYPNMQQSRSLISVYRTRADECGRLWMVDTGLLEIPNARQQLQRPAIVVFDLKTNQQILRYQLKDTDVPSETTPTGLASITVDITNGDCASAFAYVPDLTTYGLIVYSLADNDSWRLAHNYFSFDPTAGVLSVGGQRFQWSDGIFSITLGARLGGAGGSCRVAYFHPMVSTREFSVSTCTLKNRTASTDPNYWAMYSEVGDRGANSQSTMHGYHAGSGALLYAEIGRDAVSCWNSGKPLASANVAILARDSTLMSYPSDLHVSGDEVWVMANSLTRFGYSRLDTNEYNFRIYRGRVQDLIAGTVCSDADDTLIFKAKNELQ